MNSIIIANKVVKILGDDAKLAIESQIFKLWLKNLNQEFLIDTIEFQSVDTIGKGSNRRVLFIKFKANVKDQSGDQIPGIVFLRGGAVAILIVLSCPEAKEKFTILTQQPRFPIGNFQFSEIPAGMLDGSGNFTGIAAKELKEEANIVISENDLIDLTEFAYGQQWPGIIPSAGGCDEFIRLFCLEKEITIEEMNRLQGLRTGQVDENEKIHLNIIPLNALITTTPDIKAIASYYFYQEFIGNE